MYTHTHTHTHTHTTTHTHTHTYIHIHIFSCGRNHSVLGVNAQIMNILLMVFVSLLIFFSINNDKLFSCTYV